MTTVQPGTYAIDPARSTVRFDTRHVFGLLPVTGGFPIAAGTITVAAEPGASTATARITAAGFTTGNPTRDAKVRSSTYLDAPRHPEIVFTGTAFEQTATGGTLRGDLTVKEVTKPVTLAVESVAVDGADLTTRATTTIDRYDFGITAAPGMTGRILRLTLDVFATR
ncbi:YceI family protein [Actinokineospora auranticolor]|uniref:Polyisoprenoid-binding protein YceI n=1 Tax=Actinokineospora auranticolor TaxID=155976 RepID=A0A2S6GN80_9PSEU|nr:YceI family protein [Actinokineospora auranticolor]PPK66626.1 polyisoprenoid-binding protein YceI [Actinokineospora auranticolor]